MSNISPVLEFVEIVQLSPAVYKAHCGYNCRDATQQNIPVGGNNRFTPAPTDRGQPSVFDPGRHYDFFQYQFGPGVSLPGNQVWTLNGRTSTASEASAPIVPAIGLVEDLGGGMKRVHFDANNNNRQGTLVQDAMSQVTVILPPPPAVDGPNYFAPGARTDVGHIDVPAGAEVLWELMGQTVNVQV
jgi:hypothetical protein